MKVGRITSADFKSVDDFKAVMASYASVVPSAYGTCETTVVVQTGPTSVLNVAIYPNEAAADITLDAREKWFESVSNHIEDTFFYEGNVYLQMTGKGQNLLTGDPEKDTLKAQIERMSVEITQLKSMMEQILTKLPT